MSGKLIEKQPRLSLVEGKIFYGSLADTIWDIRVSDLTIIGEYTIDSLGDDYFLIFLTKSSNWYEASFYSEGRDELLSELGRELYFKLECGLCNSTDLKSRVMWPLAIKDKPVFEFVPFKAKTLGEKIKEWVNPTSDIYLSRDVQGFLNNKYDLV